MNHKSYPHSAALALIVLAFIWGYNWVVMKKVLAYCGPFDFAALRTFFGALCLFAVLAWMKKSYVKGVRPVYRGLFPSGCMHYNSLPH